MAPIARLRRGADLLYFESGTAYSLGDDFTPPGSSMAASFSGGTSANAYGGAVKVGEQAQNREVSFSVYCYASTKDNAAPQSLANRLVTMISGAGDEVAPLWFEWTLTPGLPEPIWGQFGAWRRAEVVHGGAQYATRLGQYSRAEMVEVVVTLTVEPFALGTRNQIARGYCDVDYFGQNSFCQTGLRISEGTTNLCTNPVFNNRTAWNNGWTASNLTAYENIDTNFVYPGLERSALLVSRAAAGTYYQTTTVSTTAGVTEWFSAYVKKPDSSAVTSADCECFAVTELSTTFTPLGNGVYRATASASPATSADWLTGLRVQANKSIYLLAFQAEVNADHWTPLVVGDTPGNYWDGTAHASSSTRGVYDGISVSLSDLSLYGEFSCAYVWKTDYPSTAPGDRVFSRFGTSTDISFYFNASDDKFYLTDGSNTISTAAQTWAAGDTLRLYATVGGTGLDIYINGTNAATTAARALVGDLAYYFGGGSTAEGSRVGGIIKAVEIYDTKLTAAQITALDNSFLACINDDWIDAPQIAMNNDSREQFPNSSKPWETYDFIDCISGNVPPVFDYEEFSFGNVKTYTELTATTLGDVGINFAPTGLMYDSSTAAIAVSASADEVLATWSVYRLNELMGKTVYIAARLTDAGANLQLDFKLAMGGTIVRIGYANVTADGTARIFYIGPLYIPSRAAFPERSIKNTNVISTVTLYAQRTTGGASNVELDYAEILLPNRLIIARTSAAAATTPLGYYWNEGAAVMYDGVIPAEQLSLIGGQLITLYPRKRNITRFCLGENGEDNAIEATTYGSIIITPRWAL